MVSYFKFFMFSNSKVKFLWLVYSIVSIGVSLQFVHHVVCASFIIVICFEHGINMCIIVILCAVCCIVRVCLIVDSCNTCIVIYFLWYINSILSECWYVYVLSVDITIFPNFYCLWYVLVVLMWDLCLRLVMYISSFLYSLLLAVHRTQNE